MDVLSSRIPNDSGAKILYCIARLLAHVVCVSMICDIMSIVHDNASCLQILLIIRLVLTQLQHCLVSSYST